MGTNAEKLLEGRVRIIKQVFENQLLNKCFNLAVSYISELTCLSSVWRPLQEVTSWPLAICDSRSVEQRDLIACDIVRRTYVGETYFGLHNETQRWCYLSEQAPHEISLLKIYDSSLATPARCKSSVFL